MPSEPSKLSALFHRRWAVPILAEMSAQGGCRVAPLTHALGAARQPVRDAIGSLIDLGLVRPNPGHGHPLRPEYILTPRGTRVGPACGRVMEALAAADALDVGLRKWSVATVSSIGQGASRFTEIARSLGGATDRAVSQTLVGLGDAGLIERAIVDGRPPAPAYVLSATGARVAHQALALRGWSSGQTRGQSRGQSSK